MPEMGIYSSTLLPHFTGYRFRALRVSSLIYVRVVLSDTPILVEGLRWSNSLCFS